MKKNIQAPLSVKTIADLHKLLGIPQAKHPKISVINLESLDQGSLIPYPVIYHLYCISIKKNFEGKLQYGSSLYDFESGAMTFISPSQLLYIRENESPQMQGYMLAIDRDFLRAYPLAQKINHYPFFSYLSNKALYLTEKEQKMITKLMHNLLREIQPIINTVTHELLISHIELLLTYCKRFYTRQFHDISPTGSPVQSDLLFQLHGLLEKYINSEQITLHGAPSVSYIADQLHFSPNYLSDLLRQYTGKSTRNHIQDKVIDKAKDILISTNLSIGEIAFMLGFEYPQSFCKLFKSKTQLSPTKYRESML
ncbi:helix-turn-helix domain-containing protein [Flavobacterium sp. JP2137]|uniref:helix-turn-helix domain-containing protein n=1 Tax=Flavobacterium sp. JP2137 TaxID=3414510 RepID=UPI003D2FF9DC